MTDGNNQWYRGRWPLAWTELSGRPHYEIKRVAWLTQQELQEWRRIDYAKGRLAAQAYAMQVGTPPTP